MKKCTEFINYSCVIAKYASNIVNFGRNMKRHISRLPYLNFWIEFLFIIFYNTAQKMLRYVDVLNIISRR